MTSDNTTLQTAGVQPGSQLAETIEMRSDIMTLTQATQEAVLTPKAAGGISWAERAAFACRMARLSQESGLAARYEALIPSTSDDATRKIVDVTFDGAGDRRLAALIRHVDLVTREPKTATRQDIRALQEAGVAEADIVRLAELIAFINYQIRVVAGLKLMGELA